MRLIEADQKLLQWNCQGYIHITLVSAGFFVKSPKSLKTQASVQASFLLTFFFGFEWLGPTNHMTPNTHIVPINKFILSDAFRQHVSLQRISSNTCKMEVNSCNIWNNMSSPNLSDSHRNKDQGLKEAPHNNSWVGVLIDSAMNAVPNLWRVPLIIT